MLISGQKCLEPSKQLLTSNLGHFVDTPAVVQGCKLIVPKKSSSLIGISGERHKVKHRGL